MRQTFVADRVWDGTSTQPIVRGFVSVENGTISAVGRAADLPEGEIAQDLGNATLLPGLINAHVHITFSASTTVVDDFLREKTAGHDTLMARARENLERSANVGVTTIRDLGSPNEIVFAARDQVRAGSLPGPDVIAAGEGVTSIGGHCHFFGIECEGVDAVRAAVRRQHEAGADAIKVFATGGNLTPGSHPLDPQFSQDELTGLVDVARELGLPVASHAQSTDGIRLSVKARVSTIEHCSWGTAQGPVFDELVAEEMAREGIAAAPTIGSSVVRYTENPSLIEALPPERRMFVARILAEYPIVAAMVRRMREIGVPIITGTDAGIPNRPFDDFAADVGVFTSPELGVGMSAREALVAATSACAHSLGLSDRGRLEPGLRADILAVSGDPLADIADLTKTQLVVVAGRTVSATA